MSTGSADRSTPVWPIPRFKAQLVDMGGMLLAGSPADFRRLIAEETEKWGKVVKFAGVKAD